MKVGITGAFGFIGKNFLLKSPKGWNIYAFDIKNDLDFIKQNNLTNIIPIELDLTDTEKIKSIKQDVGEHFDVVLYLAANSDPAVSVKDPLFDLKSNSFALVNFLSNFSCDKLIFFSSGAVYDRLKGLVNPDSKLNPILPYAISKYSSEQYIKFFEKNKKIGSYIIVRFFGAFGPYEPKRKIYTNLIKQLYLEDKNEFTIKGEGENYIDAIYIDDAIQGILNIINSEKQNMILDFGTGSPITINELVKRTAKALGKDNVTINHEGGVPEYIEFSISNEKMEKEFSFSQKNTLEQGIKKFAEFLKEENNHPTT